MREARHALGWLATQGLTVQATQWSAGVLAQVLAPPAIPSPIIDFEAIRRESDDLVAKITAWDTSPALEEWW